MASYLRHLTDRLAERAMSLGLRVLPLARRAPHILGIRIPGVMPQASCMRLPPRVSISDTASACCVQAQIPGAVRKIRTASTTC